MRKNKKVITNDVEPTVPVEKEVTIGSTRCVDWCFLPGLSFVGPNGLLQCILSEGHEEEHRVEITIFSPPTGKFTINWTKDVTVPEQVL